MYFNNLNIKPWILKSLNDKSFNTLTEIQEKTIPSLLNNNSLIITSRTGSGKTLCYLVPLLNKIDFQLMCVQGLIVVPTKELARQIYNQLVDFKKYEPLLKINLLIGNSDTDEQSRILKSSKPQIIISTPAKALEFIKNKQITKNIKTLIMDEFDMLIDFGFANQIDELFKLINNINLQKICCSATAHESLANKFKKYLTNTKTVSLGDSIWTNKQVSTTIVYSKDNSSPLSTLDTLTDNINPYFCIIFANTREEVNEIYTRLLNKHIKVGVMHKDISSRERKNTFNSANKGEYKYLVATDLASRGIDIDGVDCVISYGLPNDDIWFMHRIGRTGRNNSFSSAYIIYKNGIEPNIKRLANKKIDFKYLLANKDNELIDKPLKFKVVKKIYFDTKTNNEIKKIISTNSHRVRPGYKKKIKMKIDKIRQKKKHEFIEKKIKQQLLLRNIKRTKEKKFN